MRNSNSREKSTYSQGQQKRANVTQIRKTQNTLENANLNVASNGKKIDTLKPLPPKPASKTQYNVEVNMTESKIFKAKQGLQLLKKKMNRTGISRQKSHSQTEKANQNLNQVLVAKKLLSQTESKTQKEIAFKKSKPPSKISENIGVMNIQATEPLRTALGSVGNQKVIGSENVAKHDEKPISKQVDFMELLEREMKKQSTVETKNGGKIKREVNKIYDEKGQEIILHECTKGCGRMFNSQTIQKHQKICCKVFQSKRAAFNSAEYRQVEAENFKPPSAQKKVDQRPKKQSEIPKWKLDSMKLRVGLKNAKNQPISKEEQKVMQMDADEFKQCPYCNRKFNQKAAEKHIPFCQRKSKEIPKSGMAKRK